MKKSLLALAALTAFAGAASAQSSVTLFGIVDLNARNVKNGSAGDVTSMSQDGIASSRLGFRGVEDLGGGLRAGFWLEAGLNPDTGGTTTGVASGVNGGATDGSPTFSQLFNRRSTVSLLGGFGEIRLGRDYTPTFWNHTVFDPFGTNGVGSATNNWAQAGSGAATLVRANNTAGYFLPALAGFYGQVQLAAGEGVRGNKYFGGRIGYGAGPINVAVAYGVTEQTSGPVTSGATGVVTVGTMADDVIDTNVGFSWNFGFMNLMGQYRMSEQATAENTGYLLGATIPFGASTLKIAYSLTEFAVPGAAPEATQIALGYQYDVSKRTALYANYSQVDNDAGLRFTAGSGGPSVAAINGFKSTGFEVGVRHSF
jgi:predicted porin